VEIPILKYWPRYYACVTRGNYGFFALKITIWIFLTSRKQKQTLAIPQDGIGYPDIQFTASNGSGTPILVELGITHKRITFHEFNHSP